MWKTVVISVVWKDWTFVSVGFAEVVTQQKRAADGKREDLEKRLQERKQDLDDTQAQLQRYKVGCTLLPGWQARAWLRRNAACCPGISNVAYCNSHLHSRNLINQAPVIELKIAGWSSVWSRNCSGGGRTIARKAKWLRSHFVNGMTDCCV